MAIDTNFIIGFIADTKKVQLSLKELQALNQKVAQKMEGDFTKATKIISSSLDKIKNKEVFDKKLGENVTKQFGQVNTVFKDTSGNLKTMTQQGELTKDGFKTLNTTIRNGGKATRGFADNIKTLTKRALVTIPVWFALRTAIFGTVRAIRDGVKDVISFDRALQKLRRNIEATSDDTSRDFSKAQKVIEEFSLKSGKSVQEITNAIQKFATVGFDFETSLVGGLRSTQLAITLFGDAEETAQAFARSLRVLTEDITDPIEKQKEIAKALALTDQLWQTNAFEVNEFSSNLEKFAGTAKIANLSIQDTLKLLATLSTGGLSNRAGRLLRSTVLKALADIDNVTKTLGLNFNPKTQPTIVFVQELIKALDGLRQKENVPVELASTLAELFSVRSTEVLASLTALKDTLSENLALTPDIEKFDSTLDRLLGTSGSLAEQFTNTNKALGRIFVNAVVGSDNFEDSLKVVVDTMRSLTDETRKLGAGIGAIAKASNSAVKTLNNLSNVLIAPAIIKSYIRLSSEINSILDKLDGASESAKEFGTALSKAISGDVGVTDLERTIAGIQTRLKIDTIDPEIDRTTLEKSLVVIKKILESKKQTTKEDTKGTIAGKSKLKLSELILANELDILRQRGASNSRLIEAEQLGRSQLNIEKKKIDQLADQLSKERAINEEKRLQSKLGSDSIKLFNIAKDQGVDVAKQIGEVLSGNIDFSQFIQRGGKAVDVFQKEFSSKFEQQQATAFLRGETQKGVNTLRGGRSIAIEEKIRGEDSKSASRVRIERERSRLSSQLKNIKVNTQKVVAENVTIETPNLPTSPSNSDVLTNATVIPTLTSKAQILGNESSPSTSPLTNPDIIRQLYQLGERITGQDARQLVNNSVQESTRRVEFNITLNGQEVNFSGTEASARKLAEQASPQLAELIKKEIIKDLANPEKPLTKAINKNTHNL